MIEETKVFTLDDELRQWLDEREAQLVPIAVGPAKGSVTLDNFATSDGIKIPAGWGIGVTVVKVSKNANRSV